MHSLRYVSLSSLLATLAFILAVVIAYFTGDIQWTEFLTISAEYAIEARGNENVTWFRFDLQVIGVLGVITFSYDCHTSLLPILSEFDDISRYRSQISVVK